MGAFRNTTARSEQTRGAALCNAMLRSLNHWTPARRKWLDRAAFQAHIRMSRSSALICLRRLGVNRYRVAPSRQIDSHCLNARPRRLEPKDTNIAQDVAIVQQHRLPIRRQPHVAVFSNDCAHRTGVLIVHRRHIELGVSGPASAWLPPPHLNSHGGIDLQEILRIVSAGVKAFSRSESAASTRRTPGCASRLSTLARRAALSCSIDAEASRRNPSMLSRASACTRDVVAASSNPEARPSMSCSVEFFAIICAFHVGPASASSNEKQPECVASNDVRELVG